MKNVRIRVTFNMENHKSTTNYQNQTFLKIYLLYKYLFKDFSKTLIHPHDNIDKIFGNDFPDYKFREFLARFFLKPIPANIFCD